MSNGSATITRSEIMNIKPSGDPYRKATNQMLRLLKDKGAPIEGMLDLRFEQGYKVETWEDYDTLNYHVKWTKDRYADD